MSGEVETSLASSDGQNAQKFIERGQNDKKGAFVARLESR
jgi:hypothetical protein